MIRNAHQLDQPSGGLHEKDRSSKFLARSGKVGLGAAAGASCSASPNRSAALSANEKIVLGIVGIRGRGHLLAMGFALRGDCEIAYMADVDAADCSAPRPRQGYMRFTPPELGACRGSKGVEKAQGKPAKAVTDFRRVLDDKSVDAIVTGTPDHWHALVDRLELPGRQGRLRREAGLATAPGKAGKMVEAAPQVRARRPARHAEPQRPVHDQGQGVHRKRQAGRHPHVPRLQPEELGQPSSRGRQRSAQGTQLGHVERPGPRDTATTSTTGSTGTTSGAIPAATASTTASTSSTWPAGSAASTIPSRSTRPAAVGPKRASSTRPTRRWPSTSSTSW